jgi:hypothetical protein
LNAIHTYRSRDVLKLLLAGVLEPEVELAADIFLNAPRDANATWLGQILHAGSDVDAVTVNIALVDDYVSDVDTDAELDSTIFGNGGVSLDHCALDFHGAAHSIDSACEFHQGTIPSGLDDAAAVLGDLGIDEFATASLERSESAFLVNTHQAAVTGDIGREDGG